MDFNPNGTIELLRDVGVHSGKRKKYNPAFPFKGVMICDVCNKPMKASASTGKGGSRFGAYHCERGHSRNSYSQKEVEKNYERLLDNLKFTDKFLSTFEKTVYFQFRQKEGEISEYTAKANINVGELEMEKSNLVKSFPLATLPETRKNIEEEIQKIQKQIDAARQYRERMEIQEIDVQNFLGWCREIMEHPRKILEDIRSTQEQRQLYSLFFEEFPTYSQIISGTPKLSLVFKLSEEFKVDASASVTLGRIEPPFRP